MFAKKDNGWSWLTAALYCQAKTYEGRCNIYSGREPRRSATKFTRRVGEWVPPRVGAVLRFLVWRRYRTERLAHWRRTIICRARVPPTAHAKYLLAFGNRRSVGEVPRCPEIFTASPGITAADRKNDRRLIAWVALLLRLINFPRTPISHEWENEMKWRWQKGDKVAGTITR